MSACHGVMVMQIRRFNKKLYAVFTITQQAEQKFFAHILVDIFSTKSAEYTQEGL